jgi:hypothetical protein
MTNTPGKNLMFNKSQIGRTCHTSPALTSDDFASGNFTQKSLSLQIDTHRQKTILERASVSSNNRFMARLRSVTLTHSGSWLNVWPSQPLGLSLLPQVFWMEGRGGEEDEEEEEEEEREEGRGERDREGEREKERAGVDKLPKARKILRA